MILKDYKDAPSGVGPLAFQWTDKPHRLVYDLIAKVEALEAGKVAPLESSTALTPESSAPSQPTAKPDDAVYHGCIGCLTDDCDKWNDDTCKEWVPCIIGRNLTDIRKRIAIADAAERATIAAPTPEPSAPGEMAEDTHISTPVRFPNLRGITEDIAAPGESADCTCKTIYDERYPNSGYIKAINQTGCRMHASAPSPELWEAVLAVVAEFRKYTDNEADWGDVIAEVAALDRLMGVKR